MPLAGKQKCLSIRVPGPGPKYFYYWEGKQQDIGNSLQNKNSLKTKTKYVDLDENKT